MGDSISTRGHDQGEPPPWPSRCPTCGAAYERPPADQGSLIKWHRVRKGISQAQLAERIGVSEKQMWRIEREGTDSLQQCRKIGANLGIALLELTGE